MPKNKKIKANEFIKQFMEIYEDVRDSIVDDNMEEKFSCREEDIQDAMDSLKFVADFINYNYELD